MFSMIEESLINVIKCLKTRIKSICLWTDLDVCNIRLCKVISISVYRQSCLTGHSVESLKLQGLEIRHTRCM